MSEIKFLRLPKVIERTGLSRSMIYLLMQEKKFPRPIKISQKSIAWNDVDIAMWQKSKMEKVG